MKKNFRYISLALYIICILAIFNNRYGTVGRSLGWLVYVIIGTVVAGVVINVQTYKAINNHETSMDFNDILNFLVEVLLVILIEKIFTVLYFKLVLSNIVPNQILPVNQENVNSVKKATPLIYYLKVYLFGPFMEEGVFRYLPSKFISNKKVFVIVSSYFFALAHVFDTPLWILYLPLYMISSLYLGYKYSQTENLAHNILIHSLFNIL